MDRAWGAVVIVAVALTSIGVSAQRRPKPKQVAVVGPLNAYLGDVLIRANENTDYRRVLFTGWKTQLVLMSIPPGGDIGEESHARVEQVIFCATGTGRATVEGKSSTFKAGDVMVAMPGIRHNVKNTGKVTLKLYTIYAPPNHLDGRVQATKAEAQADVPDREFGRQVEQGEGGGRSR